MKIRPVISIISIAIALLFLFSTLPLQASYDVTLNNLKFERKIQSNFFVSDPIWVVSWDTAPDESDVVVQFTGGGIFSVWINPISASPGVTRENGRTEARFATYGVTPGTTFSYRVRVKSGQRYTQWHSRSFTVQS